MVSSSVLGWRPSDRTKDVVESCNSEAPAEDWSIPTYSASEALITIKVLTYNLVWSTTFVEKRGQGGSTGRLLAGSGWPQPYDVMGFQECEDMDRVLRDAGLHHQYAQLPASHRLGIAYRVAAWNVLGQGEQELVVDASVSNSKQLGAQWVRLQHWSSGRTLFVVNHQGLPQSEIAGPCGQEAAVFSLLKLIGNEFHVGDVLLVLGDFKAQNESKVVQELGGRLHRAISGQSFGGVDHIFTNCNAASVASAFNLGGGGSDHEALSIILEV